MAAREAALTEAHAPESTDSRAVRAEGVKVRVVLAKRPMLGTAAPQPV